MLWKRFNSEYLQALREKHKLIHKAKDIKVDPGDVFTIKGEEKNRGLLKTEIIERLLPGRDDIQADRLRAGKSHLETPILHIYLLELQCEVENKNYLIPRQKSSNRKDKLQRIQQRLSEKSLKMKMNNKLHIFDSYV